MFSVTSKAPNLERLTSEMGLDKGYFVRIYGDFGAISVRERSGPAPISRVTYQIAFRVGTKSCSV